MQEFREPGIEPQTFMIPRCSFTCKLSHHLTHFLYKSHENILTKDFSWPPMYVRKYSKRPLEPCCVICICFDKQTGSIWMEPSCGQSDKHLFECEKISWILFGYFWRTAGATFASQSAGCGWIIYQLVGKKDFFLKRWTIPGLFSIYFCLFLQLLSISENRTRIVGAEIQNTDH